jgi:hypothetical protein
MSQRSALSLLSTSALGLLIACGNGDASSRTANAKSGSSTDEALHSCSPLDGSAAPIALDRVVGAGRHPDGTIYVLDETGGYYHRVFVSDGAALQRRKVTGRGGGANGVIASISDSSGAFTLKVEAGADGSPTRMAVFRGELETKDFEIGTKGDVLELVDASAYASMNVRNIADGIRVQYDASRSEGQRLVIVRPDWDERFEHVRVFYGVRARMVERPLLSVSRDMPSRFVFMVDGVEYDAAFQAAMSSSPGGTLTVKGEKEVLSVIDARPPEVPGAGLTYLCL